MPLTQVNSGLLESGAALANIGSGNITPAYLNTQAQYTGFKNRIINGAFNIWQRGTSITGVNSSSSASYWADRWCFYRAANPSVITMSYSSTGGPSGVCSTYAKIQRTASNTSTEAISLNQSVEISNSSDIAGQPVTISFYAKCGANYSATSNILGYAVTTGTGSTDNNSLWNSWTGATNIIAQNATLTTSWQRFTYTASAGSSVTQIAVQFTITPTGTAGADDSVYITGVQLEKGSTATSFDYRPYGTELQLCQRYYERRISTSNNIYAVGGAMFTNNPRYVLYSTVTMRASPTVTLSTISGFIVQGNNGNTTPTAYTTLSNVSSSLISVTATATLGYTYGLLDGGSGSYIELSSEL